jgi:hypothetical protein
MKNITVKRRKEIKPHENLLENIYIGDTTVIMKTNDFWDASSCSQVEVR